MLTQHEKQCRSIWRYHASQRIHMIIIVKTSKFGLFLWRGQSAFFREEYTDVIRKQNCFSYRSK